MSTSESQRTSSTRTSVTTIRNTRLASMFAPEDVIHHPDITDGDEIIDELLRHLALQYGIGNIKDAKTEVIADSGQGYESVISKIGLAVPHGRLEKVTEPLLAFATSEQGFVFGDDVAQMVVLVLTPVDIPGAYKQILNALERACPNAVAVRNVAALLSPLAVWKHFDSGNLQLPDHLQARHIMDSLRVHLHVEDSLRTAIDSFIKFNTPELPVLNANHEIIGVVTIKRLVRTCMPDYLMWMGDMEPFLNFEPLAEIIRNENTTWLRDFMTLDFARVAEDSPAVLAMKEIGSRETLNAYVLRGRQVVGVIRMLDFIKCVLR